MMACLGACPLIRSAPEARIEYTFALGFLDAGTYELALIEQGDTPDAFERSAGVTGQEKLAGPGTCPASERRRVRHPRIR